MPNTCTILSTNFNKRTQAVTIPPQVFLKGRDKLGNADIGATPPHTLTENERDRDRKTGVLERLPLVKSLSKCFRNVRGLEQ